MNTDDVQAAIDDVQAAIDDVQAAIADYRRLGKRDQMLATDDGWTLAQDDEAVIKLIAEDQP